MNGRTNRHFVFNFSFFSLQEGYFLCVLKRTKYWESWNLRFLRNKKVPVLSDPEILEFPWKQNELRPLDLFSHVSAWFFSTLYTNTHTHTHTHTHTPSFSPPLQNGSCLLHHALAQPLAARDWWKHNQWSDAMSCLVLLPLLLWSRHPNWS